MPGKQFILLFHLFLLMTLSYNKLSLIALERKEYLFTFFCVIYTDRMFTTKICLNYEAYRFNWYRWKIMAHFSCKTRSFLCAILGKIMESLLQNDFSNLFLPSLKSCKKNVLFFFPFSLGECGNWTGFSFSMLVVLRKLFTKWMPLK